jgi:hypothetical protein
MKGAIIFTQSLVKSRDTLQMLSNSPIASSSGGAPNMTPSILLKYDVIEYFLNELWTKLKSDVFTTKETQYIIQLKKNYSKGNMSYYSIETTNEFVEELIDILKKEYPGVDFTYRETTGYNGIILERLIIMDWTKRKSSP